MQSTSEVKEKATLRQLTLSLSKEERLGVGTANALAQRHKYRSEPMKHATLQHIPLANAYLCQDCNCIGNCAVQCQACASEALIGLAGVLNREAANETQFGFTRMANLAALTPHILAFSQILNIFCRKQRITATLRMHCVCARSGAWGTTYNGEWPVAP